jgi:hypothetical protein
MKKIIVVLFACGAIAAAYSQPTVGNPDPNAIGVDTAQQKLQTVSVDKFEAAGFWNVYISVDEGISTGRLFMGGPAGKESEPKPEERYAGQDPKIADTHSYGIRVDFFRRGYNEVFILPQRPIPIEGITKTISVWAVGRNYNHVLKVLVKDAFNNQFELTMGKLNFQGWKKLSVAVPPQNPDGLSGIIQRNYHYNNLMGLKIVGFKLECDPMESYGTYYLYLDDLRAVSDLFAEDSRDTDDMVDGW